MKYKEMTKEQGLELIKSKAIHHTKDVSAQPESDPILDNRFHVIQKDHVFKIGGKVVRDGENNPVITHPFVRTKMVNGAVPPAAEPEPEKTQEVDTVAKPENQSTETYDPQGETETIKQAKELAAMTVPDLKVHFQENTPDVDLLKAVKAEEKQGQKRPQAYTLINRLIKEIETA